MSDPTRSKKDRAQFFHWGRALCPAPAVTPSVARANKLLGAQAQQVISDYVRNGGRYPAFAGAPTSLEQILEWVYSRPETVINAHRHQGRVNEVRGRHGDSDPVGQEEDLHVLQDGAYLIPSGVPGERSSPATPMERSRHRPSLTVRDALSHWTTRSTTVVVREAGLRDRDGSDARYGHKLINSVMS